MKSRMVLLSLFLLVAILVSACGGAAANSEIVPETENSETVIDKEGSEPSMAKDGADSQMDNSDDGADSDMDDPSDDGDNDGNMGDTTDGDEGDTDSDTTGDDGTSMDEPLGEKETDTSVAAADPMVELPAWFSVELTDVSSGETFTLADLQGKTVLVETMAIWCSNCLKQQREVKSLHEALGEDYDLVTVVLDIDANEDAGILKAYAAKNGFDWTYVVAPREVAREIGQLYGDQFLSPPATPMLIIDRYGEAHPLPFGIKRSDDLLTALEPFLNDGM